MSPEFRGGGVVEETFGFAAGAVVLCAAAVLEAAADSDPPSIQQRDWLWWTPLFLASVVAAALRAFAQVNSVD